ncbi:hypothetical protein BH09VER1_BH09VER1_08350 [soil metagenome]
MHDYYLFTPYDIKALAKHRNHVNRPNKLERNAKCLNQIEEYIKIFTTL